MRGKSSGLQRKHYVRENIMVKENAKKGARKCRRKARKYKITRDQAVLCIGHCYLETRIA